MANDYYPVQKYMSFNFIFNIRILYKTISSPLFYESWPIIPREDHSLRVFEKTLLRKIYELNGGGGEET